eukprot:scaffold370_cov176-Amphora_coffeaeformis.AAC.7
MEMSGGHSRFFTQGMTGAPNSAVKIPQNRIGPCAFGGKEFEFAALTPTFPPIRTNRSMVTLNWPMIRRSDEQSCGYFILKQRNVGSSWIFRARLHYHFDRRVSVASKAKTEG